MQVSVLWDIASMNYFRLTRAPESTHQSWFDRKPLIASVVPEQLNEKQGHELGDIVL
jgi:hypothetical protein